jgi:hypothetical protein
VLFGNLSKNSRKLSPPWTILLTGLDHISIIPGVLLGVAMGEALKKITVNVPEKLLSTALELTGQGITETIIAGLIEIEKREKRQALRRLRGKIAFDLDLEKTRK